MCRQGLFRADLLYRINGLTLKIPPLRKRVNEIIPLASYFAFNYGKKYGKKFRYIEKSVVHALENNTWPGNIRQLRNTIELAVIFSDGNQLQIKNLPPHSTEPSGEATTVRNPFNVDRLLDPSQKDLHLRSLVQDFESHIIQKALKRCKGIREQCSKMLDIPLRTLNRKIAQHGIQV